MTENAQAYVFERSGTFAILFSVLLTLYN